MRPWKRITSKRLCQLIRELEPDDIEQSYTADEVYRLCMELRVMRGAGRALLHEEVPIARSQAALDAIETLRRTL